MNVGDLTKYRGDKESQTFKRLKKIFAKNKDFNSWDYERKINFWTENKLGYLNSPILLFDYKYTSKALANIKLNNKTLYDKIVEESTILNVSIKPKNEEELKLYITAYKNDLRPHIGRTKDSDHINFTRLDEIDDMKKDILYRIENNPYAIDILNEEITLFKEELIHKFRYPKFKMGYEIIKYKKKLTPDNIGALHYILEGMLYAQYIPFLEDLKYNKLGQKDETLVFNKGQKFHLLYLLGLFETEDFRKLDVSQSNKHKIIAQLLDISETSAKSFFYQCGLHPDKRSLSKYPDIDKISIVEEFLRKLRKEK